MKLTAVADSIFQHVLVYGPPKTGKTQLTSELTEEFDILYIGNENGHGVYKKLSPERQARVEIVNLPDTRDYPIAIETTLKIFRGNKCVICDTHGKVDCPVCKTAVLKDPEAATFTTVELNALPRTTIVVYDSMTQLTNSAIAHITKGKPDDYKLQHDDWGNLGKLMDIFLSNIQQGKYHCVVISHESEAELEDGKTKIVPVAGTRNFSRNSAKYFDHVVYAQVSNMKHEFESMTTKTANIVVGSRTDIDTQQTGSLLPIFTGKVKSQVAPNAGQKAAGDLMNMLKK